MGQQQAQPESELQATAGTPGAAVFVVETDGHGGLMVGEQAKYSGGYRLQRRRLESRQARWILGLRARLPVFAGRQCAQRCYEHEQAGFVVLFVGAGVGRGVRDEAINGL